MTRLRTPNREMLLSATADAAEAMVRIGLHLIRSVPGRVDTEIDHHPVSFEVVAVAYATGARVRSLPAPADPDATPLLVSDRITAEARHALNDGGWSYLDRRGHLRLRAPGVLVDTVIPAIGAGSPASTGDEALAGAAGLAIAYRLLVWPDQPVSPTKSGSGFASSTVSVALRRIRDAGLIDAEGRPVRPELFWALAERWKPPRHWLAQLPDPAESGPDPGSPGWRLSGTAAAVELGAPVVAGRVPLDLYLPGPAAVTIALRRHGAAPDPAVAAASIAVPPVATVTRQVGPISPYGWPIAHPVAVALDLAQDRARGREILEDWSPPERVW